jgi:hypothetical protein
MPSNPLTDPNWATEVSEQVTKVVGTVRDKTTDNAIVAVRAVVFGLLGLLLGTVLITLFLIAATRGLQSLLDLGMGWDTAVYVSYFIIGGLLTLIGWIAMSKKSA